MRSEEQKEGDNLVVRRLFADDGRLIEIVRITSDPEGRSTEIHTDANGLELSKTDRTPDGRVSMQIKYINAGGACQGWDVSDGSGRVVKTFRVEPRGSTKKLVQYGSDGRKERESDWEP